jgi:hypothetical protein
MSQRARQRSETRSVDSRKLLGLPAEHGDRFAHFAAASFLRHARSTIAIILPS